MDAWAEGNRKAFCYLAGASRPSPHSDSAGAVCGGKSRISGDLGRRNPYRDDGDLDIRGAGQSSRRPSRADSSAEPRLRGLPKQVLRESMTELKTEGLPTHSPTSPHDRQRRIRERRGHRERTCNCVSGQVVCLRERTHQLYRRLDNMGTSRAGGGIPPNSCATGSGAIPDYHGTTHTHSAAENWRPKTTRYRDGWCCAAREFARVLRQR